MKFLRPRKTALLERKLVHSPSCLFSPLVLKLQIDPIIILLLFCGHHWFDVSSRTHFAIIFTIIS